MVVAVVLLRSMLIIPTRPKNSMSVAHGPIMSIDLLPGSSVGDIFTYDVVGRPSVQSYIGVSFIETLGRVS